MIAGPRKMTIRSGRGRTNEPAAAGIQATSAKSAAAVRASPTASTTLSVDTSGRAREVRYVARASRTNASVNPPNATSSPVRIGSRPPAYRSGW